MLSVAAFGYGIVAAGSVLRSWPRDDPGPRNHGLWFLVVIFVPIIGPTLWFTRSGARVDRPETSD
ncbi:PLDc N-terminal domain-containing protein [uncultured Microbacterium sp.]|uniref:PLDc N-terminal domain-containing protein n=1 Tax=uncultured Microbacterium sp. TaxID=191216 RepID=UPI0035CA7452